jgi:hypothetical protein
MRVLLVICLGLGLVGCSPPETTAIADYSYFDAAGFARSLLASQVKSGKMVKKTVAVNGIEESKIVEDPDSLFWAIELSDLLAADLNKPSLRNAYVVKLATEDTESNLLINSFVAVEPERVAIQELNVFYWQDKAAIRKIRMKSRSSNVLSHMLKDYIIWMNEYDGTLTIDSIKSIVLSNQFGQDTSRFVITTIVM